MNGRAVAIGVTLGFAILALVSCDDKALAARSAAQRAEIRSLEFEVENLKAEIGEDPKGDPVADLAKAEQDLTTTKAEVAALQTQIDQLQAEREQIEKDFEAYQRKYQTEE